MAGSTITVPEAVQSSKPGVPPQSPAVALITSAVCPLWEGAGLLILNKPAGIPVHGPGSLEIQVRSYLAGQLAPSLSFKPGPLHRLDQPTSGIIVFSFSIEGARYFSALLREGRLTKRYLALVDGNLEAPTMWEDMLIRDTRREKTFVTSITSGREGAKEAGTRVIPLASTPRYSLIMAELATGRTHQIRAQAAFHGHPLAGDRKYGGSFQPGGFLLHAAELAFPADAPVPRVIKAPLPAPFSTRLQEVFIATDYFLACN
jgi:23S rRNA pseudouridine955/2504/2580 synthase